MIISKKKEKLEANWEGPLIIEKLYTNKTHLLTTVKDDRIIPPTNAHFLKKYYP